MPPPPDAAAAAAAAAAEQAAGTRGDFDLRAEVDVDDILAFGDKSDLNVLESELPPFVAALLLLGFPAAAAARPATMAALVAALVDDPALPLLLG